MRSACCISALLVVLSCAYAGPAWAQSTRPDLLLLNARVITMNPQQPAAQAIAITSERITWVGDDVEARRLFPGARTLDMRGATVLPGLIDAHTHLMNLGQSLLRLNLKDVPNEHQAVAMVKERVASTAPGEWILGWGWDEGKWASHYPDNEALSAVSPRNPVYLVGLHGYAAWANKRALEIAGVTRDTKDPDNGKILHDDKTGEPTGILVNHAQELVQKHVPQPTLEQAKRAIELAARDCARNGLTSVHEAQVTPVMLQAFRELLREGRMPIRLYVMLDGANAALVEEWLRRGPEIDPQHHLTIRAFKLFADGALGSRGAFMLTPYSDAPQTKGIVTTPETQIHSLSRRSLQRGFQVCTHAIGDAANRMTLDAYARALQELPARDARFRIEHAQVLSAEDIPRFAKLGIIASMQPVHATSDMPWAEQRIGPERIKGAYAWRSLLQTGARLALGSDFPGETLNPFYGIYAAVTRQDPRGAPAGGWYPDQRMTLDQALRGYTINAAYAEFEENAKGSIAPGKLADLTVIATEITKVAPQEMLSVRVLKTMVGGKFVYDSEPNR